MWSYSSDYFAELLLKVLERTGQPPEKVGTQAYFLSVASVYMYFLPPLVLTSCYRTSAVKCGQLDSIFCLTCPAMDRNAGVVLSSHMANLKPQFACYWPVGRWVWLFFTSAHIVPSRRQPVFAFVFLAAPPVPSVTCKWFPAQLVLLLHGFRPLQKVHGSNLRCHCHCSVFSVTALFLLSSCHWVKSCPGRLPMCRQSQNFLFCLLRKSLPCSLSSFCGASFP